MESADVQSHSLKKRSLAKVGFGCCLGIVLIPLLGFCTYLALAVYVMMDMLDPYHSPAPAPLEIPQAAYKDLLEAHPVMDALPDILSLRRNTTAEEVDQRFPEVKAVDAYNLTMSHPDDIFFGQAPFGTEALVLDEDSLKGTIAFDFNHVLTGGSISIEGEKPKIEDMLSEVLPILVEYLGNDVWYEYSRYPSDENYDANTRVSESISVAWEGGMGGVYLDVDSHDLGSLVSLSIWNSATPPYWNKLSRDELRINIGMREDYLLDRIHWDLSLGK